MWNIRRAGTKPPPGAYIDYTHPLGQGLVFCVLFNEGSGIPQNIVPSPFSVTENASSANFWKGNSKRYAATQYGQSKLHKSIAGGAYSFMYSVDGGDYAASGWNGFIVGNAATTDQTLFVRTTSSTVVGWGQWSDDFSYTVPNMDGRPHQFIGTSGRDKVQRFYHDGKFIGKNTASALLNPNTNISWPGEQVSSVVSVATTYHYLVLWDRALSLEETQLLFIEPFCFLRTGRRLFSPPPAILEIDLTFNDQIILSDTFLFTVNIPINFSDALSFSDFLEFSIGLPLSFTDNINNWLDHYAANMFALNDTLSFSDILAVLVSIVKSFSDSISFSDFLQYKVIIPIILSDALSFSDLLSTTQALISVDIEGDFLLFLDSINLFKTGGSGLADSLSFSDSSRVVMGINLGFSDQLIFSDNLTVNKPSLIQIGLSDQLAFSDTLVVRASTGNDNYLRRYLNDSQVVEDTRSITITGPIDLTAEELDYLRRYLNDAE